MSYRQQARHNLRVRLVSLVAVFLYFFFSTAYAGDVTVINAGDMLKRITDQFPSLMRMVTAFAYVAGFYFTFAGIVKMKHLGESRTMMSREHSVAGPLIYLFVGAALIYLPSAVDTGMSTFWSEPNPYGYLDEDDQWSGIILACFSAVQLFGTIAFIRGLIILSHLAGQGGGQQQSLGKGLTHIVGGIFCINIYEFVKVVLATIGVTISGYPG